MDVDQIIYKAVAWLSLEHEGRRGPIHNIEILLMGAGCIFAMFVSKSALAKRKAFTASTAQVLKTAVLTAMSFTEKNGQQVKVSGVLLEEGGAYIVKVSHDDEEGKTQSSDLLPTLEDVEAYLRAHTPFILADFRR
ncbi:hypothetical protein SAMN04488483_0545 [Pseudomonas helmanticensis]|uniref:Uncharacterized protein n=1 Tax=Pseudomonas helmanticensis TaxID=1471381 RepID=A0ACD2U0W2_9PSED|nr:hypothetical protein [Pseudomonas helmanticensis]SMQ22761.1 hypothetical protein SAMN04488483_0545 [Pseudomonas helmanticensis]